MLTLHQGGNQWLCCMHSGKMHGRKMKMKNKENPTAILVCLIGLGLLPFAVSTSLYHFTERVSFFIYPNNTSS